MYFLIIFFIGNGTRQGGVLSPYLFTRYVRDLLMVIALSGIGCHVGGIVANIFAYADDMVLLAPSWHAMQELINLLELTCTDFDIVCNVKKTVCMVFSPKDASRRIASVFPCFMLGAQLLQYVNQFRYLGHIINNCFNDNDDIMREIRNLYIRTNMLISRFNRCSNAVKVTLFKTYCLCIYDLALWRRYSVATFNKLKSCYHKCIKKLFRFKRMDSMTGILFDLKLPSFATVVHNCKHIFRMQYMLSNNNILQHYNHLGLCY